MLKPQVKTEELLKKDTTSGQQLFWMFFNQTVTTKRLSAEELMPSSIIIFREKDSLITSENLIFLNMKINKGNN